MGFHRDSIAMAIGSTPYFALGTRMLVGEGEGEGEGRASGNCNWSDVQRTREGDVWGWAEKAGCSSDDEGFV